MTLKGVAMCPPRLKEALKKADIAFWHHIISAFPEASQGTMSTATLKDLQEAMKWAALEWYERNVPKEITTDTQKHVSSKLKIPS